MIAQTSRVLFRELPGAGYAAVDVRHVHSFLHGGSYRGVVVIERRRAGRRRADGQLPVVARASGKTVEEVVRQLAPIAESNAALGAAILRWEHARDGALAEKS